MVRHNADHPEALCLSCAEPVSPRHDNGAVYLDDEDLARTDRPAGVMCGRCARAILAGWLSVLWSLTAYAAFVNYEAVTEEADFEDVELTTRTEVFASVLGAVEDTQKVIFPTARSWATVLGDPFHDAYPWEETAEALR